MVNILDWLGGLISSFGGALGNVFTTFGSGIVDSIWDGLVEWLLKVALELWLLVLTLKLEHLILALQQTLDLVALT